jgi:hypothetical protein
MDSTFISAVVLIGFAIVMVTIAWKRWRAAAESIARVEALHALVAESAIAEIAPTPEPVTPSPSVAAAPPVVGQFEERPSPERPAPAGQFPFVVHVAGDAGTGLRPVSFRKHS